MEIKLNITLKSISLIQNFTSELCLPFKHNFYAKPQVLIIFNQILRLLID